VRTTRAELYRILTTGVPGSAMPAFAFYDRGKLEVLTGALDRRFGMLGAPRRVEGVQPEASAEATLVWAETCVTCHGADGRPTTFGAAFRPGPPDLSAYSLVPAAAFATVTEGVPGTMMVSFATLPEDVRWGLAELAISLRAP
jgi:mono/diheme cytochrome c family protein